eukprot:TRINITY_DN4517_c0_g1_i1.p1 TRINITY_DN4517_c0_g1~~TRINITY_DN4517_c0_g1_i1.p1  ORF type:complete len:632 (+),score=80.58 TRINITY_DN4517_c0_g1_i1:178-1896(+)
MKQKQGKTTIDSEECPECKECPVCRECDDTQQQQQQQQQQLKCPACQHGGKCDPISLKCICKNGYAGKGCALRDSNVEDAISVVIPKQGGTNVEKVSTGILKKHPNIQIVTEHEGERETLGEELNELIETTKTELVLVILDGSWWGSQSNLTQALEMIKETDVDILGGLVEGKGRLLSTPCWDLVHSRWQLHHRKPAFGYSRHEQRVMYCDTTSQIFLLKKTVLASLGGFGKWNGKTLLNDLFLRIKTHNEVLKQDAGYPASPTRISGWILVGVAAEVIYPVKDGLKDTFTKEFAEKHQIEAYFNEKSERVGEITCIKTGGNLQHSVDGRYSPLCHRYTRQRDFVLIYDMWVDPKFSPPKAENAANFKYAVSVHHGNLFGAMRMGTELLWETDGDFDLVAFNLTNDQLIERGQAVYNVLRSKGFTIKFPHRKLSYANVLKDKTDFQISLRSPKDPLTAGKPPHVHTVSVMYQGRKVFVNGFDNPWKGIRADKGHDYREHYLAQQPWVLHFTNESIHCKGGYHNACLPPCASPSWITDHNYCTDTALNPEWRDPFLWDRDDNDAWFHQIDTFK